jgi:hypothetical protein
MSDCRNRACLDQRRPHRRKSSTELMRNRWDRRDRPAEPNTLPAKVLCIVESRGSADIGEATQ